MIEKKDYQSALTQFENLLINALINIDCYNSAIETLKKKIAEFPEEKDEMPEDLKELIK